MTEVLEQKRIEDYPDVIENKDGYRVSREAVKDALEEAADTFQSTCAYSSGRNKSVEACSLAYYTYMSQCRMLAAVTGEPLSVIRTLVSNEWQRKYIDEDKEEEEKQKFFAPPQDWPEDKPLRKERPLERWFKNTNTEVKRPYLILKSGEWIEIRAGRGFKGAPAYDTAYGIYRAVSIKTASDKEFLESIARYYYPPDNEYIYVPVGVIEKYIDEQGGIDMDKEKNR